MIRDDATEAQVRAAAPLVSTWLAANAGSGKTRVLTDRVARLLLAGIEPQRILCLTYTKAAASEMQNRLFRRLGAWAMLPDAALRDQLRDLGHEDALTDRALRHARTLFARAIETPGGLKIQTIHSFCAAILRRFPLEAGVSPGFAEMEDRAATLLHADILRDMARGPDAGVVMALAGQLSEDFESICAEIVSHRACFASAVTQAEIWRWFGLEPGTGAGDILASVFLGGEAELIAALVARLLQEGTSTDGKAAEKLRGIGAPDMAALEVLETVLLTGAAAKSPFSAKLDSFPTKDLRLALGDLGHRLQALMLRVEAARDQRLAFQAAQRTLILHDFAARFLARYAAAKQARGWLDFDDLIVKARDLLVDPAVAAWVLYRLDGGIDHILVDEAQDTSPTQWEVIELLSQEMTAGHGARGDAQRTIFVVGDKKQSIYSFQGADPREFDRMQAKFADRLAATNQPLQDAALIHSFRSAPAILNLVDSTFERRQASGFPDGNRHRAFKDRMPGRVDVWPVVPRAEKTPKADFHDPVDLVQDTHHNRILAQQIAAEIGRMIGTATLPEEEGTSGHYHMRPVRAGDFLILVQRRGTLFAEIIRACKAAGLPIAGADRLKVGAELAVRDLGALMSFLAVPEDSLSLATVLRSPLFGWTEQALFDLAHRRVQTHLWPALRDRAAEFPETLAVLDDLRGKTDFLRPFDLIERILTRHDGRRRLLARLGPEADEGINAFLAQALAYERGAVPSLTGFLQWMQTDEIEIKRQMEAAGDRIRVMTVHGAKGLEAPIVILPDAGKRDVTLRDTILTHQGRALWRMASGTMPAAQSQARDDYIAAQMAERDRLLYVAMTRAEKWLIMAAAGDLDKAGACWYSAVSDALEHHNPIGIETDFGQVRRVETGDWSGAPQITDKPAPPPLPDLPAQFTRPVTAVPPRPTSLSPSDLGGAKALPGDQGASEEAALRHGRLVHLLLEHLPAAQQDARDDLARQLLTGEGATPAEVPALLAETLAVIAAPGLASLFAPNALSEVGITASIGAGQTLLGIIDRLVVAEDAVLAADFKTNATVPTRPEDVPEGLLRQMGAYHHALAQVYPGRRITCVLVWTREARRMDLPADLIAAALARALRDTQETGET